MDYLAPDFSSAAHVTIDTQVDTLDGQPLEVPGTSAIVPQIASPAAAFRASGRGAPAGGGAGRGRYPQAALGSVCETALEDHLRGHGVTTIVFCGFAVVLAEDAISGLYDRGRQELENIGVRLMSTTEIVACTAGALH